MIFWRGSHLIFNFIFNKIATIHKPTIKRDTQFEWNAELRQFHWIFFLPFHPFYFLLLLLLLLFHSETPDSWHTETHQSRCLSLFLFIFIQFLCIISYWSVFFILFGFFSVSVKVQNRVGALRHRCVKYRLTVINERATPPLRHSAATPPLLRRYCHPQRLTAFIKALMNTFLFFHCEMFKQSEFKGKTWKLTLITSNYTTTFCRVACKQHFFTR